MIIGQGLTVPCGLEVAKPEDGVIPHGEPFTMSRDQAVVAIEGFAVPWVHYC